ncbi:MAG TPA: hypothetical protein VJS12_24025 [Steroidobacteraceae bacterium]|nr:hypothetical protein [Steroidobacteraceae bacterium]
MTSLKERFSNAVESLFLGSILVWSVLAGAAAVSNPLATHEPRGTVEIHALADAGV